MNCLNRERASKIAALVREVEKLSDTEKLLLYLQLPYGRVESSDANKHKHTNANNKHDSIFAKKSDQETTQTYTWILSHLEEDPNVSLPKQEVYDEYRAFCQTNRFEPLCVADFGKAMKHALPCIKPRRLGQRGNSRYCYSGLRKKYRIEAPSLPNLIITSSSSGAGGGGTVKTSDSLYYQDNNNSSSNTIKIESCNQQQQQPQQPHQQPPPPTQPNTTTTTFSCAQTPTITTGSCTYTPQHPHQTGSGQPVRCKLEPCGGGAVTQAAQLPECCRAPAQSQDYQHQQNHLQPLLTQSHTTPANYQPEVFAQHRCASPDDDEYGHNYHDLNRPIAGPAMIPFVQNLPGGGGGGQVAQHPQPALNHSPFISPYTNGVGGSVGGSVGGHATNLDAHHSVHHAPTGMHQKVQAACCEHQEQKMVTQSSPIKQDSNESCSSPPHNQFATNQLHHHQQQQHHQQQHLHHEHDALHLNLSLLDPCGASSQMDFCTSPFQSPASTPYPRHETGTNGNYAGGGGGHDSLITQDYYSSANSSSDQLSLQQQQQQQYAEH